MSSDPNKEWFVYVVQSLQKRPGNKPGFYYVGCTTDVKRRLLEHNGLYASGKTGNPKGSRYTSKLRPWDLRCIHGPYLGQSNALKAERALKHGKRGVARTKWSTSDSIWCRGLGADDPLVTIYNAELHLLSPTSFPPKD